MGHWLGSVGMQSHDLTFNLDSVKAFLPAIFETFFSYHKVIWIGAADFVL